MINAINKLPPSILPKNKIDHSKDQVSHEFIDLHLEQADSEEEDHIDNCESPLEVNIKIFRLNPDRMPNKGMCCYINIYRAYNEQKNDSVLNIKAEMTANM